MSTERDPLNAEGMSYYRAFLMNEHDRVFASRRLFCRDDVAAVTLARKVRAVCWMIEVWDRTTMIAQVTPRCREP